MTNYYTNASFVVDVESVDNQEKAQDILEHLQEFANDPDCYTLPSELTDLAAAMDVANSCCIEFLMDNYQDTGLWFRQDESINVDQVCEFIQYLIQTMDLKPVGFEWANDCDKARIDAYGGGACFITKDNMHFTNGYTWIDEQAKAYAEGKIT